MTPSLTEILYNNNVLFSYYGFIDANVNNQVLAVTKSKLQQDNESMFIIKRVYNAINECVENIVKHSLTPNDNSIQSKSLLLVYKQGKEFVIDTLNIINQQQKNAIDKQLAVLNIKTKEELKAIKMQLLSNGQYSTDFTAGLGFVDMVLKTDSCDYCFENYQTNFLFNINFKIHSNS